MQPKKPGLPQHSPFDRGIKASQGNAMRVPQVPIFVGCSVWKAVNQV